MKRVNALPGRPAPPSAGQRFVRKAAPFEGNTVIPLSAALLDGSFAASSGLSLGFAIPPNLSVHRLESHHTGSPDRSPPLSLSTEPKSAVGITLASMQSRNDAA